LQQEISPEQMRKLLVESKTDLLPGFISQRTVVRLRLFWYVVKTEKSDLNSRKEKPKLLRQVKPPRKMPQCRPMRPRKPPAEKKRLPELAG
jgi:DNA topoisomerase-3